MLGQQHDVARPAREVRHRDREHGKAVVQVLSEQLLRHQLLEVAAGGRDEADVRMQLLVRPDAGERTLLQEAQQLDLDRDREVADLVEEERSAVRRLGATDTALRRPGEGTLLVAEQLALHERFRKRRAVERDERLVPASRQPLDCPRHQLLARAARAADEHGRLARRDLADLLVDGPHLAAVPDQVARIVRQHVAQPTVLLHQRLTLRQILAADRRRLRRDVRDDLKERHVARQIVRRLRARLVQAVD